MQHYSTLRSRILFTSLSYKEDKLGGLEVLELQFPFPGSHTSSYN